MADRDGYIAGVPCWADTYQPDPEAALDFYSGLFGWEFENVVPESSGGKYFIGRIRGGDVAAVTSVPEGAPRVATWNTFVWVDNADETADIVRKAGGTVVREPFDVTGAGRMAVVSDPEGAAFCLWQAKGHKGSRIVNEHGSVNFNVLAARDTEGAKAFYGAVFGWKAIPAQGETMWWALPGYADHLEETRPGLRKQAAEFGAPEGFVDVVAAFNPIAGNDSKTPANWGIAFGVNDADATAATAVKLGGQVVAGPFDAPWSRLAVIKDPQGATFSATQFVPENKDII
ncbi:MAG TPA: VOC family protein [Acidimicrobiales bacterium]|nr:VOC family protein [Acidimicrobiales bacterium]